MNLLMIQVMEIKLYNQLMKLIDVKELMMYLINIHFQVDLNNEDMFVILNVIQMQNLEYINHLKEIIRLEDMFSFLKDFTCFIF